MSFSDAVENLIETAFDTFSQTVTLNGESVSAVVHSIEQEADGPVVFDVLRIEFQASDYAAVSYRSDTLVAGGETWSYPKLISYDGYTKLVQFRKNVKVGPRR